MRLCLIFTGLYLYITSILLSACWLILTYVFKPRLHIELGKETVLLKERHQDELMHVLERQEEEFSSAIENAARRAVGMSKVCQCKQQYLCRHNRTSSYNTRRPSKEVVKCV